MQPSDGATIVFTSVPPGSYTSPGVPYRVEAPSSRRGQYRFVNASTGASTYDPAWAVARAIFSTVAEA